MASLADDERFAHEREIRRFLAHGDKEVAAGKGDKPEHVLKDAE
jgi:hypothetical protein